MADFGQNYEYVGQGGELTGAEEAFVQNLAGLAYVSGDILYHNGTNLTRLAIGSASQVLTVSGGFPAWGAASGGSTTFLALTDTPSTYTGFGTYVVRVNSAATALEFVAASSVGVTDHGALTGLTDDDHTQYALLAGRSGGQIWIGGTGSGDDATIQSTSHATKGSVFLGSSSAFTFNETDGTISASLSADYTSTTVPAFEFKGAAAGELTGTGAQTFFKLSPRINQVNAGGGSYTIFAIDVTETSTDNTVPQLFDFKVGGVRKFRLFSAQENWTESTLFEVVAPATGRPSVRFTNGSTVSSQIITDASGAAAAATAWVFDMRTQVNNHVIFINQNLYNYAHGDRTDPYVYIHSRTGSGTATDQWTGFAHNTSVALWETGKGNATVKPVAGSGLDVAPNAYSGNLEAFAYKSSAFTQTITGAVASARFNQFMANTINASTAQTVTDSTTVYVSGATVAGGTGPATITNNYALWVDDGLTRLDGGVVFAGSGQSTLSNYTEGTFTPTVTLVGGVGNTTPVYSTNTGRHTRIGDQVFTDVYLTGDGGAEGAGTGRINIALPIVAGVSHPTSFFPCGYADNGATEYEIWGQISSSATTIELVYFTTLGDEVDFTGADQNNVTRIIRLKFFYEI